MDIVNIILWYVGAVLLGLSIYWMFHAAYLAHSLRQALKDAETEEFLGEIDKDDL